jgi:hypothetical protein
LKSLSSLSNQVGLVWLEKKKWIIIKLGKEIESRKHKTIQKNSPMEVPPK